MTNLEQLVPPFELCRKIPADAFNGTALVWWASGNKCFVRDRHELGLIDFRTWHEMVPAPTAQEILEAMGTRFNKISFGILGGDNPGYSYFCECLTFDWIKFDKRGDNLPEALLKLWLDVREVEHADQEGNENG